MKHVFSVINIHKCERKWIVKGLVFVKREKEIYDEILPQLEIKINDLEQARNFATIDTTIIFLKTNLKGGDGDWYYGTQTINLDLKVPTLK